MPFSGEFVQVRGVGIHVHRMVSDGPVMVMLHGLTDSGECWGHVASRFWPQYHVVAPDLRGHGRSDAPKGGRYAASDHASDVLSVMDALELGSAVLVGHSLGAETALEVARMRPDRVRALIMEDPPWSDDWIMNHPEGRNRQRMEWLSSVQQLKALRMSDVLGLGRARTPNWSEEELLAWAKSKHEFREEALDYFYVDHPAWQLTLRQLHCPSLLVTGETKRGALVSESMAAQARGLSANLEVLHVPSAGHCVHRDQLEPYLSGLQQFLARI